jgi:O6-methylguanine-DNA--protein-cysteine methyltransferase
MSLCPACDDPSASTIETLDKLCRVNRGERVTAGEVARAAGDVASAGLAIALGACRDGNGYPLSVADPGLI